MNGFDAWWDGASEEERAEYLSGQGLLPSVGEPAPPLPKRVENVIADLSGYGLPEL
ncbi:hypothetical protein ACWGB8_01690 [Kitasatospora sp. NPDC054939]